MTWGMITFWWSQLVEYQIKPGERRMESVEGKRREKRLSISRGKLLQVKPESTLRFVAPSSTLKLRKALGAQVGQTLGSVFTTEDLSFCFID